MLSYVQYVTMSLSVQYVTMSYVQYVTMSYVICYYVCLQR